VEQRPWNMGTGLAIGSIAGLVTWWSEFEHGMGLFQKPQLIIVPAALGVFAVTVRNKRLRASNADSVPPNQEQSE